MTADDQSRIRRYGYAGLIPFLVAAFTVWVLPESSALIAGKAFLLYSAVIISFLGGMLWGSFLLSETEQPGKNRLVDIGILASLVAWSGLLLVIFSEKADISALVAAAFAVMFSSLRHDESKRLASDYPPWFDELRGWLSRCVVACHISVFVFFLQL